jgi:hypothetical protein
MPLILAIEPDRRQASQLTAMVRGRLHAELVLGESAERALAALGQRVPDLILTSALLSPKDENALGERLRALDGAAAHVQTLTIPVLASGSGRGGSRAGGVLSALRREKAKLATHEGCDPGVFAEQCKEYLERAESERIALAEHAATAALDAQADAEADVKAAVPVTRASSSASGRENRKSKSWEKTAAPAFEPAPEPFVVEPPIETPVESYSTAAFEPPAAAHVEAPPPEPAAKRKGQKGSKKKPAHGIRSVLGLTQDENDGPASLLAAVAALEAEEQVQVEPMVAPVVDAPGFDAPIVAAAHTPFYEPIVTAPPIHSSYGASPVVPAAPPIVSSTPIYTPYQAPVVDSTPIYSPYADRPAVEPPPDDRSIADVPLIRPKGADAFAIDPPPMRSSPFARDTRRTATPADQPAAEDILDLSSLLDTHGTPAAGRQATTYSENPVDDVYELDNSLLSTSFEDAVRPLTTDAPSFAPASVVDQTPRAEERSWRVLDTLMAETAAFQSSSGANGATAPAAAPLPKEAPLGDILEALRRDAEQLPPPAAPPSATAAAPAAEAEHAARGGEAEAESAPQDPSSADAAAKKKKKRSSANPAQDEWGFFDPDQCGFAALIEKLEEITDKDDTPAPRRA